MARAGARDAATTARFLLSAPSVEELPDTGFPEVAFAGRSNVGKSSLLGAVLRRPRLVRTSRTPGRTRALNLFLWEERLVLVDLPGYGYAALSKVERARLRRMLQSFVASRQALRGVVLLLDIRREQVSDEDRLFASLVLEKGRRLLVAITKTDLVGRNRRRSIVSRIERDLAVPPGVAVLCSSATGEGREELAQRLRELSE